MHRAPASMLGALLLVSSACSTIGRGPLGPGHHVDRAGDRRYDLHVPVSATDRVRPLVVAFHGAFSSPAEMEEESGLSRLADREGFVVAYPHGTGFLGLLRHWNSGHCCGPALEEGVDDVEFTRQVIEAVSRRVPIDRTRIYLVGMSNGAMMAQRVAAELSNQIAAAAAVSGTIGGRPTRDEDVWRIPSPLAPVPMMLMHGDADEIVPYEGGTDPFTFAGRTWLSVDEAVDFWRRSNHASQELARETLADGRVTRREWRGSPKNSRVVLYRFTGWGHAWPGGPYTRDLGPAEPLAGFEAAEPIWAFLSQHELRS